MGWLFQHPEEFVFSAKNVQVVQYYTTRARQEVGGGSGGADGYSTGVFSSDAERGERSE